MLEIGKSPLEDFQTRGCNQVAEPLFADDLIARISEPGEFGVVDANEDPVRVERVVSARSLVVKILDFRRSFGVVPPRPACAQLTSRIVPMNPKGFWSAPVSKLVTISAVKVVPSFRTCPTSPSAEPVFTTRSLKGITSFSNCSLVWKMPKCRPMDFVGGGTVHPGPRFIHEADVPVQVGQGDAVGRLLHGCFELQNRLLCTLLFGDIADCCQQDRLAFQLHSCP